MNFDQEIKSILSELGLTEIQINFYLTLLKSGGNSVSNTALTLKINRTNSYVILEKLKSMNLVWEENTSKGKVIHAKSYESLLQLIKEKESKFHYFENTVNSFIPIFNSFDSLVKESVPRIKVFDTKQGVRKTIMDILKKESQKEVLLFTNQKTEKGFFSKKQHDDFIKNRVENNIFIRVLAINNDEAEDLKKDDKNKLRETRLLPANFNFSSEIYIYDNKICMLDVKENIIGVTIESEELFKIHVSIFDTLWNICR